MNRRKYISQMSQALIALGIGDFQSSAQMKDAVIGHGEYQYKIDVNWGALNPNYYPVEHCHEMVIDKKGRIILLTNHTKNNIIIYSKDGKLLDTWGSTYPGAHGLTLVDEGGEEFLYICDNDRHQLIKTDLFGREVMVLDYPQDSDKYESPELYIPTESAVADNGDIYVADGYGSQYIIHYDPNGSIKNVFGGRGDGEAHFTNAHGICIDKREGEPTLLITERQHNVLKRFSLSGRFIESYPLPGCFICRPVIKDKNVYLATIWSDDKSANTGFISILDKDNRLVSAPGGIKPIYEGGVLQPMRQALRVFHHPHDVCIDDELNIYVAQWNTSSTYPIKLIRV